MYAVTAHVETVRTGKRTRSPGRNSISQWTGSVAVPTFYLDENVQGFTGHAGADRVARQIVNPLGLIPDGRIHISAAWVPERDCAENHGAGVTDDGDVVTPFDYT